MRVLTFSTLVVVGSGCSAVLGLDDFQDVGSTDAVGGKDVGVAKLAP